MMENVLPFFANLLVSLYQPLYVAALVISFVFVISGTMDLFIDLSDLVWRVRRFFIRKELHPLTMERSNNG